MAAVITSDVFAQISSIASDAAEIAGRDIECGGFLVADSDGIVRRMWMPLQYVTENSCSLSRHFRELYTQAYSEGLMMAGMWHSHGRHGLFHSEDDYGCLRNFLSSIRQANENFMNWHYKAYGNMLDVFNMHRGYRLMLKNDAHQYAGFVTINESLPASFHSIVINNEAYGGVRKYHALEARLSGENVVAKEEEVEFSKVHHGQDLGGLIVFNGKPLKELEGYAKWKAKQKGSMKIEGEKAGLLNENLLSVEELPRGILEGYKRERISEEEGKGKAERETRLEGILRREQHEEKNGCAGEESDAAKYFAQYALKLQSYAPFYARGGKIVNAIRRSDEALLGMFATAAGKYDESRCPDCKWKRRIRKLKGLYAEFTQANIMGREFYSSALEYLEAALRQPDAGRHRAKVERLCNKISGKGLTRRLVGKVKRMLAKKGASDGHS